MKRIFLYAYDRANLGDDLFVRTIVRRYPDARFYMRGDDGTARRFGAERNLKILKDDRWLLRCAKRLHPSLAARLRGYEEQRCDAVVYIGGSLFIEYDTWPTILTWWRYEAENRPFFVLSANFGPWHTEEYRAQMGQIFGRMRDVCFRDRYSTALFPDVNTVRYAPDILLSYPMPRPAAKKQAFISVIDCASKDEGRNRLAQFDAAYTAEIAALADRMIEQGRAVVFSSFCRAEGDEDAIGKILACMRSRDGVRQINYDGTNAEQVLAALAESEIVYATRFHAAILGFAAGRPVVPIIYSDKTTHVLKDLGFRGRCLDIRTLSTDQRLPAIRIDTDPKKQLLNNPSSLIQQAQEHFTGLDLLLNERLEA